MKTVEFDHIDKPLVSGENFKEIIFVVEVKSTKQQNLLSSKISCYTVIAVIATKPGTYPIV